MFTLTEGELTFEFPTALHAVKFDGAQHGLSHCMMAVDFVVELPDRYLFVEVKDPANSKATPENRARFAQKLASGALCQSLTGKLRDSLLYRWAEHKLDKDVYYLVLLELPQPYDPALYLTLGDKLAQQVPTHRLPTSWARPLVKAAAVLNVATWNTLGVYGSVRRAP